MRYAINQCSVCRCDRGQGGSAAPSEALLQPLVRPVSEGGDAPPPPSELGMRPPQPLRSVPNGSPTVLCPPEMVSKRFADRQSPPWLPRLIPTPAPAAQPDPYPNHLPTPTAFGSCTATLTYHPSFSRTHTHTGTPTCTTTCSGSGSPTLTPISPTYPVIFLFS